MIESDLHILIALLDARKEHASALAEAPPCPLNAATASLYELIVPLDLEHSPVLLNRYCRISLLLTVFLRLTKFYEHLGYNAFLKQK